MKAAIMWATAVVVGTSSAAMALDKAPVISLDLAKKMAAGCEAKAREMNWKMNISVVDAGANEIFFERQDGAFLGSSALALHKAQASAHFPFPTRFAEQLAYGKDLKGGVLPGFAQVPGVVTFAGGLPIMTEDKVQIGAIGVSGGTADQDEACAQAGLDAVKDALK
ncbi:MAG: heme-binding protein [Xanthobacteraceae bacterium]|nr:heme-binding protein [Xanthobacteraceae bacterium]